MKWRYPATITSPTSVDVLGDLLARLHLAEILLPGAADRAHPVVGDVLEGRTRIQAAVGVALLGVVDKAARLADPLLGLGLLLCLLGDAHESPPPAPPSESPPPSSGFNDTPIAFSRRLSDLNANSV